MANQIDKLRHELEETIELCREESAKPNSFSYLPTLIDILTKMLTSLDKPITAAEREMIAGGVGRILTEDYKFDSSPLGLKIVTLANRYIRLPSS